MKKFTIHSYNNEKSHPIIIGLLAIFTSLVFGVSLAFATGLITPSQVFAQVVPPCCTLPPPPSPPPPPPPPPPVVVPPPVPTCTISASPTSIKEGESTTLSWQTTAASDASLNNGLGSVDTSGTRAVSPTKDTTYTLSVSGPGGETTCDTKVIVVPPPPAAPTCTLSASPTAISSGGTSSLSWTTTHASSFTIDNSVGSVTPVAGGSTSVSPTATTTYTGVAKGPGGTVTCHATVTVTSKPPPPPPAAPTCTLSASPTAISSGGTSSLSWTTTNAISLFVDHGVGTSTPTSSGNVSVSPPPGTTVYTATAKSADGKIATCEASVTVGGGGGGGPSCTLSVSPLTVQAGDAATLSWGGAHIKSVYIDNGIGTTSPIGSQKVSPPPGVYTYTGTFTSTSNTTLICKATLSVKTGGGGCVGSCGGTPLPQPRITLTALPHPGAHPLAFVSLSQIPYTGLSLGPVGTAFYWLVLVLWSFSIAYFLLFIFLPGLNRRLRTFGVRVQQVLNAPLEETDTAVPGIITQEETPFPRTPSPQKDSSVSDLAPEAPRGYSRYEGFRSLASHGTPTVDDIVRGLARTKQSTPQKPPTAEDPSEKEPARGILYAMEHIKHSEEEEKAQEESTTLTPEVAALREETESASPRSGITTDVRGFIAALLEGDRPAVFAALRHVVRGGGNVEHFLTDAVVALDDAYRARIDGTDCDPDIVRLSAKYQTPVLEKIISALTIAIDSSYTSDMTGAKLALSRALNSIGA